METPQFYDLLLDLTEEWQVTEVETDYKTNEVFITIKKVGLLTYSKIQCFYKRATKS